MKRIFNDLKSISNSVWFITIYTFLARVMSGLLFHALVYQSFRIVGLDLAFCVMFALIIYVVSSFIGPRLRRGLFLVCLLLMSFLFTSQFLYFKAFKTLYTVYSMLNFSQVLEFYKIIINLIMGQWWVVCLFFIPFIGGVLLVYKAPLKSFHFKKESLLVLLSIILIWVGVLQFIDTQNEGHPSVKDLYHNQNQVHLTSKHFGLLTAMRLDIRNYFFPVEVKFDTEPVVVIPEPVSPDEEFVDENQTDEPEILRHPWVLEVDFNELENLTTDETLQKMDQYFSQVTPTYSNEYTGIAKDFNLIFITAESYSRFSVDPVLTPTLYMMQEQGLKFTNFYNPVWGVSTSDGEYVGLTGLIPKSGVWSLAISGSQENDMVFSYGNLLRRYDYYTMAFHNHTFDYYRRDISHPNLGYEYIGVGNGLDIVQTWPESDIDLMNESMDRYMDYDKFHAYYMTVSGHMNYLFSDNYIATKNRHLVDELEYQYEESKAYLATQIEFDKAMETLLAILHEKNLADKTLIVVNADHYPYGLPKGAIDELAGESVEEIFELYRSSLLVYFDGIEPATIDKYSSSLDILPTIYNLMDIPFDSRLLAGRDILSDEPSLVMFVDHSWITDLGRYNANTQVFTPNIGIEVDEDYVASIHRLVNQRFDYSRLILEKDYYRHFNELAKWPQ